MSAATAPPTFNLQFPNKQIEALLLWRDPKRSGAILAAATLAYFFLALSSYSIVSMLATAGLILVVVCNLWAQCANWFKSAGPPVPKFLREGVSESEARSVAEKLREPLNEVLAIAGKVLTGKDLKLSALAVGVLAAARYIFAYVSVLTLAYTVLLAAFTLPKLYEVRKADADRVVAIIQTKYNEAYAKFDENVKSKIPAAQKKAQ